MAEYNVQINKYNANSLGYDQLYPQPMKHADTHLLNGSDPINVGELGVSNRNLLDNAYWANPDAIIDQRGGCVVPPDTPYYSDTGLTTQAGTVSAYTTASPGNSTYGTIIVSGTTYYVAWSAAVRGYTGAGYGIDRWKMVGDSAAVVLDRGFVTLHGNSSGAYWLQYIENKELYGGKMCTFSALYSDNVFHTVSGVITEGSDLTLTGAPGGWDIVKLDSNNLYVQHSANAGLTKSIIAAKLELGTVQTLAHQDADGVWQLNEIPDYGEQLARCQRYHFEFGPSHALIAYDAYGVNSPVVYFPVQMRTVSAIKVYSKAGTENAITYWNGSAEVDFTDFYPEWNENFVVLRSNGKFTPGGIYTVGKLIAYADL